MKLIVKEGRKLKLTNYGKAGLTELNDGFGKLNRGVSKIRQHTNRQALRISVEPAFATRWLVERLSNFQEIYGEIDVLIDSTARVVSLEHDDADIAIRYSSKQQDDLHYYRLFTDETVAVCSPNLLASKNKLNHSDILLNYPLIHYKHEHGHQNWNDWTRQMGRDVDIKKSGSRFTEYNLLMQSAVAGLGIVLASKPLVANALKEGLLVEAFDHGVINGYNYDVVIRPDEKDKPEISAFIDWLLKEVRL